MTLRISSGMERGVQVVCVEGRLDGASVGELQQVLAGSRRPLALQLRGLRSADESGVHTLRELKMRKVPFRGLSPYLTLLIDTPLDDPSRSQASAKARNTLTRRLRPRSKRHARRRTRKSAS